MEILKCYLRVTTVVNEASLLFEIVDGRSIDVETIAPKATNKCSHRIEANEDRVNNRS